MSWLDGPTPDPDDLDALDSAAKADPSDPREKMDLPPEMVAAVAQMGPIARMLKGAHDSIKDAGFSNDQAFTVLMYFITQSGSS